MHSFFMMSMRTILIAVAAALCISGTNGKQQFMKRDFHARQAEAAKRYYSHHQGRQTSTVKNITFSNPKVSGETTLFSTIFKTSSS